MASSPLSSTPSSSRATRSTVKSEGQLETKAKLWWILDGSVVIRVSRTLFKLHRTRLVDESTFFGTLLSRLPQDTYIETGMGKLPMYDVNVEGIDADKFAQVLEALYNALCVCISCH